MVLPFRQEGVLDEHEQEGAFTGRYSVYTVKLEATPEGVIIMERCE